MIANSNALIKKLIPNDTLKETVNGKRNIARNSTQRHVNDDKKTLHITARLGEILMNVTPKCVVNILLSITNFTLKSPLRQTIAVAL